MKQSYLIFGVIVVAIVVFGVLFGSNILFPKYHVLTENPVVINKDISGAPSSPMDLELSATQFSDDKTSEITAKISKREGYPIEAVNWTNTNAKINLPEGLELVEGDVNWQGDIVGNDQKGFKIKVRAVQNGEWTVEASAKCTVDETNWYGDTESFYVLVKDNEVLISDRSFTPVSPIEKGERTQYTSEIEVSVCDLANNPTLYTNKTIQVDATVKFVGENYYAQKGDFFLENDNCRVQVFSWVPITAAHCPPNVENCEEPATMVDYLDRKVKLNGIFKELPKEEYINKKWTVVGTYYAITNVKNVSIIQ